MSRELYKVEMSGSGGGELPRRRAGLRLLEEHETRVEALRKALSEGEESGLAEYSLEGPIQALDAESNR